MSRLFSTLLLTVPLIAGLLGSATTAQAQAGTTATIPFQFSANNQQVTAGTYKVELLSNRVMCLRNLKTGRTRCMMVRPESEQAVETQSRLVFQRSGIRNYLTQVWIAGTNIHSELVQKYVEPSPEKAKTTLQPGVIEVAMK